MFGDLSSIYKSIFCLLPISGVTTNPADPQCGGGEDSRGPFAAGKRNFSTRPLDVAEEVGYMTFLQWGGGI